MNTAMEIEKITRIQSRILKRAIKGNPLPKRYLAIDNALQQRLNEIQRESYLMLEKALSEYYSFLAEGIMEKDLSQTYPIIS